MRVLRICLLLLLAALIPVRGVVAASMNCPPAQAGAMHHHHGAAGDVEASMPAGHGHGDHAGHSGSAGTCHLCCDLCAGPMMLGSPAPLPGPQDWSRLSFPDVSAPAPRFLSDGQERPPRSS